MGHSSNTKAQHGIQNISKGKRPSEMHHFIYDITKTYLQTTYVYKMHMEHK